YNSSIELYIYYPNSIIKKETVYPWKIVSKEWNSYKLPLPSK
ncbi:unnamed protein product, partial [marine sediment metagenome]